eukprot:4343381-Pyramimonas_sp.AAC.1
MAGDISRGIVVRPCARQFLQSTPPIANLPCHHNVKGTEPVRTSRRKTKLVPRRSSKARTWSSDRVSRQSRPCGGYPPRI